MTASINVILISMHANFIIHRFSRSNRIFAGLWFGKGKPHFPTFLQPFAVSLRKLYTECVFEYVHTHSNTHTQPLHTSTWKCVLGISILNEAEDKVAVHGILLDVTMDSPAKALWLQMKQFNGYYGCPKCKEKGRQHVIGIDKGGRKRQCHIYPYNQGFPSGHCEERHHHEVKKQALQALKNRMNGMKSVRSAAQRHWHYLIASREIIILYNTLGEQHVSSFNPFTPESDQCQNSPAASQEI